MSATLTVEQAVTRVDEAVERVKNDAEQRFPDAASVGDAVRQGDIYIQKIDDVTSTPKFYRRVTDVKYPMQLAPGNTKGSRHMLEESDGATVYVLNTADIPAGMEEDWEAVRNSTATLSDDIRKLAIEISGESEEESRKWRSKSSGVSDKIIEALEFSGPIFNLTKEGKVSHPEHGDWVLPPGSYRVTFQRTVASNLQIRRVFD
jgi:hypothetical protein